MLHVTCRSRLVLLLIAVSLLSASSTEAWAASTPSTTKTTIVHVNDDDDGGVDATSLLDSAVSGLIALGGVGIGVAANRRIERGKAFREECASQIADIDALIDGVTTVTNRLPVFQSGNAQQEDVLGLQADLSAVRDARNRVRDTSVRGAVDVFSVAVKEIIREPKPGKALSDQAQAATSAADMIKARAEEAKDVLREESAAASRKKHRKEAALN